MNDDDEINLSKRLSIGLASEKSNPYINDKKVESAKLRNLPLNLKRSETRNSSATQKILEHDEAMERSSPHRNESRLKKGSNTFLDFGTRVSA